jgi:hypothetical protein
MINTMLMKLDPAKDPDALIRITEVDLIKAIKMAQTEGEKIGYSKAVIGLTGSKAYFFEQKNNDIKLNDIAKFLEQNQGEFLGE